MACSISIENQSQKSNILFVIGTGLLGTGYNRNTEVRKFTFYNRTNPL